MITAEVQRLNTPRGVVEYFDIGTGLPTLYFHGTGAAGDAAILLEQELLQADCRLIVPNRPGYYGSALEQSGSAVYCAAQAAVVLDHLSIAQAVVIGTSGGGMPAAAFARGFPRRTAGLILQCAQSHEWDSAKWLPTGLAAALFLFRHRVFIPFLRWQNMRHAKAAHRKPLVCLKNMSGSRFPKLCGNNDVLQAMSCLSEMTLQCAGAPAGIQNDWAIMVGQNGVCANSIDCPTLIIHDRTDPLVPFEHAKWSRTCIPHGRLLEVHAGGHLIWFGKDSAEMHDQRMVFMRQSLATPLPSKRTET